MDNSNHEKQEGTEYSTVTTIASGTVSGVLVFLLCFLVIYFAKKKNLWCFKIPKKTFDNRRSLPPLPGHIYEEMEEIRSQIKKMDEVENKTEKEILNDGYLVPKSIEENEYFEPTLNQFQIINVTLSNEGSNLIPMASYEPSGVEKTNKEDVSKYKLVRFEAFFEDII